MLEDSYVKLVLVLGGETWTEPVGEPLPVADPASLGLPLCINPLLGVPFTEELISVSTPGGDGAGE